MTNAPKGVAVVCHEGHRIWQQIPRTRALIECSVKGHSNGAESWFGKGISQVLKVHSIERYDNGAASAKAHIDRMGGEEVTKWC